MVDVGFLERGANRNTLNPMGRRADQIIDNTGNVSEKLDYSSLAFRQIERTVLAVNKGFIPYIAMIKITEKILKPFLDKKYWQQVISINQKIKQIERTSYTKGGQFDATSATFKLFDVYTDKLGLIIDSLSRRGILPKEDVEVIVGEAPEIDEKEDVYLNPPTDNEIKEAEEKIKQEIEEEIKEKEEWMINETSNVDTGVKVEDKKLEEAEEE